MFIDKNGDYESNSLLPVVVVLAVIAVVAIIAGVILLIFYIKLKAAYKRSYCLCFCHSIMPPGDFDQHLSMCLRNKPLPVGFATVCTY